MKGYVITLLDVPESVAAAQRCVDTGAQFGVEVKIFPATHWRTSINDMRAAGLRFMRAENYERPGRGEGAFMSGYRVWNKILSDGPALVLEHDAYFVGPVTDLTGQGDIINVCGPPYNHTVYKRLSPEPGVHPLFSAERGHFMGNAGYWMTPAGAASAIYRAERNVVRDIDDFLNLLHFPKLKELYPWPVETSMDFSTVRLHNLPGNPKGMKII